LDEGLLSPDFPIPYITWPELLDDFHDHAMLELGHSTGKEVGMRAVMGIVLLIDERFGGRLKPFIEHLIRFGVEE
jgi:hypothetical protein